MVLRLLYKRFHTVAGGTQRTQANTWYGRRRDRRALGNGATRPPLGKLNTSSIHWENTDMNNIHIQSNISGRLARKKKRKKHFEQHYFRP